MAEAEKQPEWFRIGDELLWPLIGMGLATARSQPMPTVDLRPLAELALCHHAGCMEASIHINRRGKHSAAVCLIRQSVEALTIAEIGLQPAEFAEPLLAGWNKGKKSHGELRKALEREVWPNYGSGLWDETWSEFYGNLARAVQPYAHYTSELQGWQLATIYYGGGREFLAMTGLETYTHCRQRASRCSTCFSRGCWGGCCSLTARIRMFWRDGRASSGWGVRLVGPSCCSSAANGGRNSLRTCCSSRVVIGATAPKMY